MNTHEEIEQKVRAIMEPEIVKQVARMETMIKNAAETWHVPIEQVGWDASPHIMFNPNLTTKPAEKKL